MEKALNKDMQKAINKAIKKEKIKVEPKVKKPVRGYALYVKEHGGISVVGGVDYKGKPKDKMRALGVKWRGLSEETKKSYK